MEYGHSGGDSVVMTVVVVIIKKQKVDYLTFPSV